MSFQKTIYYGPLTIAPKVLAEALTLAMEKANGPARSFDVINFSFGMPDGLQYQSDSAHLSEVAAFEELPADLELLLSGDGPIESLGFDLELHGPEVYVSSQSPDALHVCVQALEQALGLRERTDALSSSLALTPKALTPATTKAADPGPPRVLLFTALNEERAVLEETLALKTAYEDGVARGVRHGVAIELISARRMGRVPASVTLTAHLARFGHNYRLIVVGGIAGGFAEAGVEKGAVILGTEVIDLATRKEHDAKTEFRPAVFPTDDTFARFVRSSSFDHEKWEKAIISAEAWPQGRRPYLLHGPLACTDEIVSSDAWRAELIAAWAKLQGIEMESGGACAAAAEFGQKVSVIRAVSDLADPRKSDDQWRRLGMRAVAHTIDALLASQLLLASKRSA